MEKDWWKRVLQVNALSLSPLCDKMSNDHVDIGMCNIYNAIYPARFGRSFILIFCVLKQVYDGFIEMCWLEWIWIFICIFIFHDLQIEKFCENKFKDFSNTNWIEKWKLTRICLTQTRRQNEMTISICSLLIERSVTSLPLHALHNIDGKNISYSN